MNCLRLMLLTATATCFVGTALSFDATIDYTSASRDLREMPRFWVNTGLAPPEPIDNVTKFFDSHDFNMNLEIIGSLPNKGLKYVRIHWLLNLLEIEGYDEKNFPVINFKKLDEFLSKLIHQYKLRPTIEFMTSLEFKEINRRTWKNFAYQIIKHYIEKFGISNVSKWRFESWNEPDISMYNRLNFTLSDYLEYMHGTKDGINEAQEKNVKFDFRGPAGLFNDPKKHVFCWSLLEHCNKNVTNCPIDILTYHRKGTGVQAKEIIDESFTLLEEIFQKFPNLSTMKYSNTEADPIKKWSEPRDFQGDAQYASILVETVLQHWQAIFEKRMTNLESISHDNGFMNFYPYMFTQRTLLARFQMNNTSPKYTQFLRKPVYTALGLISNIGTHASNYRRVKDLSYVVSSTAQGNAFYSCIIILTHVNTLHFYNKTKTIEIEIENLPRDRSDLHYFVEAVDSKRTNPSSIYDQHGRPPFPTHLMLREMQKSQGPRILENPTEVVDGKIFINAQLMKPFVISVRVCSNDVAKPKKPFNLRIRQINKFEIMIFWSDIVYKMRCIKTYEIFFRYQPHDDYKQIETGHLPFLYHQMEHTIPGCFKVRSLDIANNYSRFSKKVCFP